MYDYAIVRVDAGHRHSETIWHGTGVVRRLEVSASDWRRSDELNRATRSALGIVSGALRWSSERAWWHECRSVADRYTPAARMAERIVSTAGVKVDLTKGESSIS
jgi:hypothetical protein